MRTARISPDDVRIRQAATGHSNHAPDKAMAGRPATRSGTNSIANTTMKFATGPVRCPTRPSARRRIRIARPVRWLAWPAYPAKEEQAASGATLVTASPRSLTARYGKARRAFLPPGPTRSRSIRQRECDDDGTGAEGVDEIGRILSGLVQRAPSPLCGGESKIMILASAKS